MPDSHLDNAHCFKGMGQSYWRDLARGLKPTTTAAGPQGHRIVYTVDGNDGFALQNGGISAPQMDILPSRPLIRFMRAGAKAEDGLQGNWWLDADGYQVISSYAENQKLTLAQAANRLLVVPREWSDCGQMLVVRPKVVLMCYRGKGQPVALLHGNNISPHGRRVPGTQLFDAPPGTNLEQIFIPGERQFLPDWMSLIAVYQAGIGAKAIPILDRQRRR